MTLVLSSKIFGPAFHDAGVEALLSDEAYARGLLEVEGALARVQGRLGVIPEAAAQAIASAAQSSSIDMARLAQGVLDDGVPIIALVGELRVRAGAEAAPYVHFGATSQDIMDTASVLALRRVLARVESSLNGLMLELAALADTHRVSVMAARTHGQQAVPTSFGLKVATWASPLPRHRERLRELRPRLCVVQLGGAAGTLAALGPQALDVVQALAAELGVGAPLVPWHTQRDTIAELGHWLTLLSGSLGKMAQDVILLCQTEVAEVSEAPHGQRGGSSSMPQKNNPMLSERVLAASRAVASQAVALSHALVQEHERGTHGWQVEWLSLTPMLMLSAGCLANSRQLISNLQVYPARMRENLLGQFDLPLSEAAVSALSGAMPRPRAQALVKQLAVRALSERRSLIGLLREHVDLAAPGSPIDWEALADPEQQLGQADALIDRVLTRLRED